MHVTSRNFGILVAHGCALYYVGPIPHAGSMSLMPRSRTHWHTNTQQCLLTSDRLACTEVHWTDGNGKRRWKTWRLIEEMLWSHITTRVRWCTVWMWWYSRQHNQSIQQQKPRSNGGCHTGAVLTNHQRNIKLVTKQLHRHTVMMKLQLTCTQNLTDASSQISLLHQTKGKLAQTTTHLTALTSRLTCVSQCQKWTTHIHLTASLSLSLCVTVTVTIPVTITATATVAPIPSNGKLVIHYLNRN